MANYLRGSAILICMFVSGCASFGNDDYGCKGMPEGSTCMSTVEIYEATNSKDDLEVEFSRERNKKQADKNWFSSDDEVISDTKMSPDPQLLQKIRNQQRFVDSLVPDAKGTVPVLKSAEVLRFWVSDYETSDGQYSGESVHFVEVTPRKWSTGEVHETEPEVLHPIQVIKPKPASKP